MKKCVRIKINAVGIILITFLFGCQSLHETRKEYVRNHEKDYLSSRVFAPLIVPADLSQIQINETFPLPENLPEPGSLPHISLKPPGFGELSERI